jgi:hypothetical protein
VLCHDALAHFGSDAEERFETALDERSFREAEAVDEHLNLSARLKKSSTYDCRHTMTALSGNYRDIASLLKPHLRRPNLASVAKPDREAVKRGTNRGATVRATLKHHVSTLRVSTTATRLYLQGLQTYKYPTSRPPILLEFDIQASWLPYRELSSRFF